jgi:DNA polymerase-3 subunit epsilon
MDTETTGLEVWRTLEKSKHKIPGCDIWQLAMLVEINGKVEDKKEFLLRPRENAVLEPKALEMIAEHHGMGKDQLFELPEREEEFKKIQKFLGKYVNKFRKTDKFLPIGYNVNFDVDFLRQLWLSFNDNYYGSWFLNAPLDVMGLVGLYVVKSGAVLKNFKLGTVCAHFGIMLDAHKAMDDIEATRVLFLALKGLINRD